jgi:hypothetical protein
LLSFEKLPKCLNAVHEINCSCERWSTKLKTSAAVEDGAQSQHPQDDLLLLKKHKIVEENSLGLSEAAAAALPFLFNPLSSISVSNIKCLID